MRSNRRLVLTDRIIPFLAAAVGLVALGGAVMVQFNASQRAQLMAEEVLALRAQIEALAGRDAPVAATEPANDGTIEAMLALQDRMNRLEQAWDEQAQAVAAAPAPTPPAAIGAAGNAFAAAPGASPAAVDPGWPTTDCIPMGTRFMVSLGDETAICQTPVKVKVSAITDDSILVDGTGVVNETAFRTIPGSNCTLTLFSADGAGFAELRVSCQ